MKKTLLFASLLAANSAVAIEIPDFLDKNEIENATFKCLTDEQKYSPEDQKYVDTLWQETLKYLEGYAVALSTSDGHCRNSDLSMYQSNTYDFKGPQHMCIMDNYDMKMLVKHLYSVIANPDKAKKCFGARENVDWIYSPGGKLEANSPVAKWLKRMTFDEFFDKKVKNEKVKKYGHEYAKNFDKMVTGDDIQMPETFPFDISAKALPNLWASVGWFPMYAEDSERNKRNFEKTRGNYAYGEVLGHWGLLRIDEIDGVKVGAEVGMTAQRIDSFYPYHNHATSEIYYAIRKPACANEFKTLALKEDNPLLKTVSETNTVREVELDVTGANEDKLWAESSTENHKDLTYLHQNTIHAFQYYGANCHAKPHEKAFVSIWARSNAHDKRWDYGTTLLCESAKNPNTPALRKEKIRCDLTKVKY